MFNRKRTPICHADRGSMCLCELFNLIRKFWQHYASVYSWAAEHPGCDGALPLSLYGDEARFNDQNDKFIALVLQSPLLRGGAIAQRLCMYVIYIHILYIYMKKCMLKSERVCIPLSIQD